MSQIVRCAYCRALIVAGFPLHYCRQQPQVDQGPEFDRLYAAVRTAEDGVDQKRAELARAEAELREKRAALSAYWRAKGAKG